MVNSDSRSERSNVDPVSLGKKEAWGAPDPDTRQIAGPASTLTLKQVVEDPNQPWWWRKIVGPAVQRVNDNLDPKYQTTDLMRGPSIDWCRFRRENHCYFPKHFDAAGSAEAGYNVWIPEDRGLCARFQKVEQQGCSVSEPGPNSGEALWAPDATYSWKQGGQRWDRKYS